jgi:threonine dehydrogenase-like Zn-dependent dehydrogenase
MHQGKTMRAAVLTGPQKLSIETVPVPVPAVNEVRVRLEGCGICASNIPTWDGMPWSQYPTEPGGLGHEGWGVIDAIGEAAKGFQVGDRVAMVSNHAYAQFDTAPAEAVVKLPPQLDSVPFPGEPLGCAMNIFARSKISAGETVAIVGIGFLGAILTRLASCAGARVLAISRRPYSLKVASAMGAAEVIPMDDQYRIIDRVKSLTDDRLCDCVIEAVGKQWPLDLSAELVRERGRLIVAGYHQDGPRQVNMQLWNWKGLDVINAHERELGVYTRGIRSAAEAVLAGSLDPSPLFTHSYQLEDLGSALNDTRDRPERFMKALVIL